MEMPGSCGFVSMHKKGMPLLKAPLPFRGWEALLTLEALALAGRTAPKDMQECADVATAFWWELCEGARAPNGAMTLPDQRSPNASPTAAPRTLATHGWVRLTAAVIRLTGECAVADELELSMFNAAMFACAPSVCASECADEVPVFGGPERRDASLEHAHLCGLGILTAPASTSFVAHRKTLTVHLYHPAVYGATLPSGGGDVTVAVDTQFPHDRLVRVTVRPRRRAQQFTLRLRVPGWAVGASAEVDLVMAGQPERHTLTPGTYVAHALPCLPTRGFLSARTHTHTLTHARAHTLPYARARTHTHTHTRTRTRTRTRTHTHAHAHTHTQVL
jgi:hypothetical protein